MHKREGGVLCAMRSSQRFLWLGWIFRSGTPISSRVPDVLQIPFSKEPHGVAQKGLGSRLGSVLGTFVFAEAPPD